MKKSISLLFFLALCMLTTKAQDTSTYAHDVIINFDEVALVDLEGPGGVVEITLNATASATEAGEAADFGTVSDNTLWLNYTSIVGNEASRDITVAITNGALPAGISLDLVAAADAGNGDGTIGTPSAQLTLSGVAQNLVTGIGSAYTGTGVSNGHNLTYSLGIVDFSLLDADNSGAVVEVTYTITDTP